MGTDSPLVGTGIEGRVARDSAACVIAKDEGVVSYVDGQRIVGDEGEAWKTWGIIEIAVRNVNVSSYMNHWEGRALKAEAELAKLRASDGGSLQNQKETNTQSRVDKGVGCSSAGSTRFILRGW